MSDEAQIVEDQPSTPVKAVRSEARSSVSRCQTSQTLVPKLPLLKIIGYGTGVHVSLMERSSPVVGGTGTYRSPWAVKHISRKCRESDEQSPAVKSAAPARLLAEADLLRRLNHPCVVGYRGTTVGNAVGSVNLMMEAAQCSLMDLIEQQRPHGRGTSAGAEMRPMDFSRIAVVGFDIGAALHYLHKEHHILHGDVKSANVLVFDNFSRVKLCDFGVCVQLNEQMRADAQLYVGTQIWAPPEVNDPDAANNHEISDRADIFAYALTLWEMFSWEIPHSSELYQMETGDCFTDEDDDDDVTFTDTLLTPPALPVYSDQVMDEYRAFIEVYSVCVNINPSERPSAQQCMELFREFRDSPQSN